VGEAIIRVARHPVRQVFAGWSARPVATAAMIAPRWAVEAVRLAADTLELAGEPAAPTPGNLFEATHEGDDVRGGWRARKRRSAHRSAWRAPGPSWRSPR